MLVFIQKHMQQTCNIQKYMNIKTHIYTYLYIKYIVIHRLGSVKKKIKTTKTIKNKNYSN